MGKDSMWDIVRAIAPRKYASRRHLVYLMGIQINGKDKCEPLMWSDIGFL